MSAAPLLVAARGGVATLTLNRPERRNALSEALLAELGAELRRLAADDGLRCAVLTGAGGAFSAGHDLAEVRERSEAGCRGLFALCSAAMLALRALPVPVVAAVRGVATAAGCQLVAACDIAIAAESARFATSGIDVGLFCSTPAVALTRAVPMKAAMDMLMTGRFVDAAEALRLGLVSRVVPDAELDGAAADCAAAIAAKSPAAVRLGKRLVYEQAGLGLAEAYALAGDAMARNAAGPDAAAGIGAFLSRRRGGTGR